MKLSTEVGNWLPDSGSIYKKERRVVKYDVILLVDVFQRKLEFVQPT